MKERHQRKQGDAPSRGNKKAKRCTSCAPDARACEAMSHERQGRCPWAGRLDLHGQCGGRDHNTRGRRATAPQVHGHWAPTSVLQELHESGGICQRGARDQGDTLLEKSHTTTQREKKKRENRGGRTAKEKEGYMKRHTVYIMCCCMRKDVTPRGGPPGWVT